MDASDRGGTLYLRLFRVARRSGAGFNLVQLAIDAADAAHGGAAIVIVSGDAKLIPLFTRLEEMDTPVTLVSSRAVPASIVPPPPLIDLNEDERFFLAHD